MSGRMIRTRKTYHKGGYVEELSIADLMEEAGDYRDVVGELEALHSKVDYLERTLVRLLEASTLEDSKILEVTGNKHLAPL